MAIILDQDNLSFDDVQLLDGYSDLRSRSDVKLTLDLPKGRRLALPIFSASMITVATPDSAAALLNMGGGSVLHRYADVATRIRWLSESVEQYSPVGEASEIGDCGLNGVAIGLNETEAEVESLIVDGCAELISIDVAAANNCYVFEQIKRVAPICDQYDVLLMVGNFSSQYFVDELLTRCPDTFGSVDFLKVSQGGGRTCSTRVKTGIGKPTFQAVHDLHEHIADNFPEFKARIVADGGLRTSGDIVKALGAGASCVMLGTMLAGHVENVSSLTADGLAPHYGMASKTAKSLDGRPVRNIEGVEAVVQLRGRLYDTLTDISDCIRSGIATAGYDALEEFIGDPLFIRVTQAGISEAGHI